MGALLIDSNGVYPQTNGMNCIATISKQYALNSIATARVTNAKGSYIVFRFKSSTDYYRYGLNALGALILQQITPSGAVTLKTIKTVDDVDCELMVEDKGTSIDLYFNKVLVASHPLTAGSTVNYGFQISNSVTRVKSYGVYYPNVSTKINFTPSLFEVTTVTYTRNEGVINANGDLVTVNFRIDGTRSTSDTSDDSKIVRIAGVNYSPQIATVGQSECTFANVNIKAIFPKMVAGDTRIYFRKLEGATNGDVILSHLANTFSIIGNITFIK